MGSVAYEISWDLEKQPWSDPVWCGNIRELHGEATATIFPTKHERNFSVYPLHVWEMPQPLARYTVAVDPSMGKEHGDPAAIQVVGPWGKQVAEMLLQEASLEEQCAAALWLGNFYNEATLVVEMNGIGSVVFNLIDNRSKYKYLYWDGTRPGFTTTAKSRDAMIKKMQNSLRLGYPILRSRRMKNEFSAYRGDGPAGDDLLMAMMIAHYCCGFSA